MPLAIFDIAGTLTGTFHRGAAEVPNAAVVRTTRPGEVGEGRYLP
jgi:hypothetical protein